MRRRLPHSPIERLFLALAGATDAAGKVACVGGAAFVAFIVLFALGGG